MNTCYTCKHSTKISENCIECIVEKTGAYSMWEPMDAPKIAEQTTETERTEKNDN